MKTKTNKLSNNDLHELTCLHGEMIALLDKYSHLEGSAKWQTLKRDTEKYYQKLNDAVDDLLEHG